MNKKVILGVLAVLAFFAGQIWLESVLTAAGATKTFSAFLVPAFELVAGGFIGYFFKKVQDDVIIDNYETQYSDAKAEMISLENQIAKLRKTSTKRSTTKVS